MRKGLGLVALAIAVLAVVASAQGATGQGVQVSVLTKFREGGGPAATAATNSGDVVALAGANLVEVGPTGKQKPLGVTFSGGTAFGIPIGVAYDRSHQLYVAFPQSLTGAQGTILKVSASGNQATPVAGSEGMVSPDGFGLDSKTGNLYVTDIFGNGIWRIGPDGSAQLWTSLATDPLVVLPDGIKIFENAAYVSIEHGTILRIPINPDGSAGAATIWAQVDPATAFFDDLVLDDRTGDVYVTRLDTNELLRITPSGDVTTIATNADGLLGAANMSLVHAGQSTVIYLANGNTDFLGTGGAPGVPAVLKITITP